METPHYCRTRTGTKIHGMYGNSSVTICGHWQKAGASYFKVDPSKVRDEQLCERCFGPNATVNPEYVEAKPETDLETITLEELRSLRDSDNRTYGGERFFAIKSIIEKREEGMALETIKTLYPSIFDRATR